MCYPLGQVCALFSSILATSAIEIKIEHSQCSCSKKWLQIGMGINAPRTCTTHETAYRICVCYRDLMNCLICKSASYLFMPCTISWDLKYRLEVGNLACTLKKEIYYPFNNGSKKKMWSWITAAFAYNCRSLAWQTGWKQKEIPQLLSYFSYSCWTRNHNTGGGGGGRGRREQEGNDKTTFHSYLDEPLWGSQNKIFIGKTAKAFPQPVDLCGTCT